MRATRMYHGSEFSNIFSNYQLQNAGLLKIICSQFFNAKNKQVICTVKEFKTPSPAKVVHAA